MVNSITDFSRVIAELESGQFNVDCSQKMQESLNALQERCDVDGLRAAKAQIAVVMTIVLDSGNLIISADVQSKNPPKPRLPFEAIKGGREVVNFDQERKDIYG